MRFEQSLLQNFQNLLDFSPFKNPFTWDVNYRLVQNLSIIMNNVVSCY